MTDPNFRLNIAFGWAEKTLAEWGLLIRVDFDCIFWYQVPLRNESNYLPEAFLITIIRAQ